MTQKRWLSLALVAAVLATALPASAQRRNGEGRGDYRGDRRRRDNRDDRGVEQPVVRPTTGASSIDEGYGLLLQRSIFARNGVSSEFRAPVPTQPASKPLTPEQQVVFYGVLAQDDQFVAFAENHSTGQILLLRAGDPVANGRIAGITLDALTYSAGGKTTEVLIGQNLSGETVALASTSSPTTQSGGSSSGSSASGGASTAGMSAEQKALLEKMKARRAAQGAQ